MHFHPVARHGAGFRVMIAASSVAVLAGLTSSIAASGQSAGDTIKRMQALYNTASTYQGTVKELQSGKSQQGQPFTATRSYAIKFKRPNMVKVLITVSGTGAAAVLNGTSMLTVLDGKTAYQYNEKTKQYLKQPAPPKVPILVSTAQAGLIPYDLSSAKNCFEYVGQRLTCGCNRCDVRHIQALSSSARRSAQAVETGIADNRQGQLRSASSAYGEWTFAN